MQKLGHWVQSGKCCEEYQWTVAHPQDCIILLDKHIVVAAPNLAKSLRCVPTDIGVVEQFEEAARKCARSFVVSNKKRLDDLHEMSKEDDTIRCADCSPKPMH
jgi:hypothetical protein